jgi:SRSO17 transposase
LKYLQGILSATARKNGWQLAEYAGEGRPDGMQRLLSQAVWDTDGVRDDLRRYVLSQVGGQGAIGVLDETSFPKRGTHSAGVGIQYCGATGAVENCQVGVFLGLVTPRGHALIDRELYLPQDWCEDQARRQAAGIPQTVRFQSKPELARLMLQRLMQALVKLAWVVADTVYGGHLALRRFLQEQQLAYVLAVAKSEPVELQAATSRRREEAALVEAHLPQSPTYQRLSMSQGTKGPRLFDWAAIPMLHGFQDDGRHFLLIRRDLADPAQKRYSFVFAPPGTTLSQMVQAIGARWRIEEDFENGKDMGLDHYEVRSFIG